MSEVLPDPATTFGARVAERLQNEQIVWLTTVAADGTPQPNPVWFLWDGDSILIYNQTIARRLKHIQSNPHVSLNFNSKGGSDIIVITGEAAIDTAAPPAASIPAYVEKYAADLAGSFANAENFAGMYPVAVRVRLTKVRGF